MSLFRGGHLTIGKIAGVPIRVSPTWFIVAAVITIGAEPLVRRYLPDLGGWIYAVTFAFAVLLYLSVFLHEVSHALMARRLGLPVKAITLHFLGGYTEIERESPTPGGDLLISAAGPIVSLLIGGVAYVASLPVQSPVTEFLFFELAIANLVVGVFNILPALPLDGGHILRAFVWKITGDENRGTIVAARAGQILAVLVLLGPFVIAGGRPTIVSVVWAALIAMLVWGGASRALSVSRLRARLPRLDPRRLARRALSVTADLPISEAIRKARESSLTALVVVDSAGRPTAVVNHSAVSAIPDERRPWVSVGDSSRTLSPGLILRLDVVGDELLRAMRATPASEYLIVDNEDKVYGVLVTSDVDAALAAS